MPIFLGNWSYTSSHMPIFLGKWSYASSHMPIFSGKWSYTSSHMPIFSGKWSYTSSRMPIFLGKWSYTSSHMPIFSGKVRSRQGYQFAQHSFFGPSQVVAHSIFKCTASCSCLFAHFAFGCYIMGATARSASRQTAPFIHWSSGNQPLYNKDKLCIGILMF